MNIAMVAPSQIDAYMDRVTRFVENVNALKDRVNELLAAHTPANEQPIQITDDPVQKEAPQMFSTQAPEPAPAPASTIQQEAPAPAASQGPSVMEMDTDFPDASKPQEKTAEDINLDDILSSINFDDALTV